ncbi:hypothetical protein CSE45_0617 [Citreicella sp. SE45]|nr:hypothetical protein CSE45_0617 [Citreicella sp. SE45]
MRGVLDHAERIIEPLRRAGESAVGDRQDFARTHHVLLTFDRTSTEYVPCLPRPKPIKS